MIKYGSFFVLFDYHRKPRAKAIFLQYTVYLAILPPPLLPFSMQHPLYRTLDSSSYPHSSLSFVIQGPSSHINTELTNDQLPVHLTYPTFYRTATTLLHMSLSAESLSLQCKHTATEQATDNGDPLLSNKKARQAAKDAKMGSSTSTATAKTSATEGPPAKKAASMVCTLPSCLHPTTLTFPQPTEALHSQTSTHIEIVDDDDDIPCNVPPSKSCRILELSHGSNGDDDEDLPALMETSDNEDDEAEEVEEMAEAELGKSLLMHLSLLVSDPNTHAEHLVKEWNSPIYVFFKHTPSIELHGQGEWPDGASISGHRRCEVDRQHSEAC